MMINRKQEKLDQIRESYVLKKAKEMAEDIQFIQGFTLKLMSNYTSLLSKFVNANKTNFDKFIEHEKDKNLIKILGFIFGIPELLITNTKNKKVEINNELLNKSFFRIIDEEKITKLKNNLKEIDQKFKGVITNSYEINLSNLYEFGEFILNFLKNTDVRQKVASHLLNLDLDSNNAKLWEELSEWIIYQQIKVNNIIWDSKQNIQNLLH